MTGIRLRIDGKLLPGNPYSWESRDSELIFYFPQYKIVLPEPELTFFERKGNEYVVETSL